MSVSPSISRITSRTPLRNSLPLTSLMAVTNPRKNRNRASFILFLALFSLTTYIFFIQRPALSSSSSFISSHQPESGSSVNGAGSGPIAAALEHIKNSPLAAEALERHRKLYADKKQQYRVELTTSQELAAVSNFLSGLPSNVIPHTVDPSNPIDPQLILEFDTRGVRASEEVEVMVEDTWVRNPVFLYSKLYSPVSREIKQILTSMHLRPAPTFIDVDIRDDAEVLKPILKRLTGAEDLPILLVGGKPVGSVEQIRDMAESGELMRLVREAGASAMEAKKKKGRK